MIGEQIGQYRVLALIGEGGMGAVYRASDDMLAREVALKVLDPAANTPLERFRTEAVALARLSHPGIATVHQLLEHRDRLVMVMEFVRGQSLLQFIEKTGVVSPERAADICMQVLDALAHAHGAGVVHRDLKPGNLMVTETGTVKIMDFGIARLDGSAHLTQSGFTMGTPAYMAPEQLQGRDIDARADLYAVGVILYRLISGTLPFRGDSAFAMSQAQIHDSPTPIDDVRPDLPSWVHEVVTRALGKEPEQRFQSAQEFRDCLAGCLAGLPVPSPYRGDGNTEPIAVRPAAPPPGMDVDPVRAPADPPHVPAMRQRPWAVVLALTVVLGVPGTVVLWPGGTSSPASADAGAPPLAEEAPVKLPISQPTKPAAKPANTPGTTTPGAAEPATAMFSKVKLLSVNGTRTVDRDVLLLFSNDRIAALPKAGGIPITAAPYRQIARATYAYAADPQWDPRLSAPAGRIDVPGFLGRSRHWLVLQTPTMYTILRLDGEDYSQVLQTFESRSGLPIARPTPAAR